MTDFLKKIPASCVSACLRGASRFHHDDRGAISVLVLLTIWCLVGMLAMVWNTTEQGVRRQRMQTAADSAAHATTTWMARSVNAIAAQNMVICQDASTETIWRAIPPTDSAIATRLDAEIIAANQMRTNPGLANIRRRMQGQLANIATEFQLTSDALEAIQSNVGANYANPAESISYQNEARRARSVMNWAYNTYVNGAAPPVGSAPQRPGPPGPNGEGLAQLVTQWQASTGNDAILDHIINFINTVERPILTAFQNRTRPATSQAVDVQMAAHRQSVFATELAMAAQLPDDIEAQRAQLADYYQTDITLANLQNSPGSAGPARIRAPLLPAAVIPGVNGHLDLIRLAYPVQAARQGLSPIVDIDPISPHTNAAMIWHPNIQAAVDPALMAQYPGLASSYLIRCMVTDGWGHNFAAPLERYFHDRVSADQVDLNVGYMVPLDESRTVTLAADIRRMLGLPNLTNIVITPLPRTIPDDQPAPILPPIPNPAPPPSPPVYVDVPVLPVLNAPPAASAAYRTQVQLYNQHGAAFTGAINALRGSIQSYIGYYDRFVQGFAQQTWSAQIFAARRAVAENLGLSKQFMVLATYRLQLLPAWARDGMYASAALSIEDQIVRMNIAPVAQAIVANLIASDPNGIGGIYLDPTTRNNVLRGAYIGQATAIADAVIRPTANRVAALIALEWISRPWPFEITPPNVTVPPYLGLLKEDRQRYFSVIAAARETPASAPRLLLPAIFGTDSTKLIAYAQAEAFNWMEFNPVYGAAERFDQVVPTPWGVNYPLFVGSPRPWRAGTVGGWNWRSRLSLSDALAPALDLNDELREYFNDAGITNPDQSSLEEVNVH